MRIYSSTDSPSSFQSIMYHAIPDIWFYLLAAAVLEAMAVHSWRYRKAPAAMLVSIGFALRAVWLVALVMITICDTLSDKVFWLKLQQMCAIAIVPLFLLIILHISGYKHHTIQNVRKIMLSYVIFFCLLLLTTEWTSAFWKGIIWDGKNFGIIRGPAFWVNMVTGYCIIAAGVVLCFRWSQRVTGLRRWQAYALLFSPVMSIIGHYSWFTGLQITSFSMLPFSFMTSSIVWGGIFLGLRVFSLMELAETTVTRSMNDSLIVIDAQDYIVELNPAAQRLFGNQNTLIGSPYRVALAPWPSLVEIAASHDEIIQEIQLSDLHSGGCYRPLVIPLTGWNNRDFGKVIVLHDISEQKKAQAVILDQHKAISIMTERERLSRELHDGAGQLWSYINMQVEAACSLLDKSKTDQATILLQRLAEVVRNVHVDIRASIAGLRHTLWQPLEEYIDWFNRNHDIDTKLIIDKKFMADKLPLTTRAQLLRIIQESLTNIRKHAEARHAAVFVRYQQNTLEIRVTDDGRGFNLVQAEKEDCYGLRIMKERAEEAGAQLRIESAPANGTTIIVSLPLK